MPLIKTRVLAAALSLGLTVLILSVLRTYAQAAPQKDAAGQEVAPDVPDAIAVPAAQQVQFVAHAKGSQVYTCKADADGKFAWTLKGPEAELRDRNDKVMGQHFADPTTKLPTWKLKDGSEVSGKAAAHVDAIDSGSIPWLLVNVVSHAGKGRLADVATIQRVHTHGGKPGNDACDESHKDAETKSDYTADYYFFAPAK